jgi:hypothetical protein
LPVISDKKLITRTYKNLRKVNPKRTSSPINKWANEQIIIGRSSINDQKIHEDMFNIPGHQGNASLNDNEISSHPISEQQSSRIHTRTDADEYAGKKEH